MSTIVDIFAREILDSRGNPTVEADVLRSQALLGGQPCLPVLRPAFMKLLN